jgi:hypothetical protein
MKVKFLLALALFLVALASLADLSNIHSVIKIPIRTATLLIMLSPIYFVMYKETSIKKILFAKKFQIKEFKETLMISVIFIAIATIIRYFTTTSGEIITFGNSLHYKEYLPLYLSFGYLVESFLQDMIFILIYKGLSTFVTTPKKSFLLVVLVFGAAHLFFSIWVALFTMAGAILFLTLYLRYQNIFAVTTIHYLVGVAAIAFGWT